MVATAKKPKGPFDGLGADQRFEGAQL